MAKLNQAKKLLLISNEGEFEKSGSEPLNDDHESISSRSNVHSITRNVDQGCSLFDGINRCYSAAESNAWQQSLEPINDTVAIENLDTYSYFDGENHSHYAIGDTSNSKKKRYRYRGFSSSISQLFSDESVVCGAFSCFGLLLSCRTIHLLQQRQQKNSPLQKSVPEDRNPLRQANKANYIISLSLMVTLLLFFASILLDPNSVGLSSPTISSPSHARSMTEARSDAVVPHPNSTTRVQYASSLLGRMRPRVGILTVQDYSIVSHLPTPLWIVSFVENMYLRSNINQNRASNYAPFEEYYYSNGDDYYGDYEEKTFDSTLRHIALVFFLLLLGIFGTVTRRKVRREILRVRQQQDKAVSLTNPNVIITPIGNGLNETSRQSSCAHIFFGCYPVDPPLPPIKGDEARQRRYDDCSQRLFSVFSSFCCGCLPFCSCWLQCFGICALAQEAREAKNLISVKDQRIDYITHQPWEEYEAQLAQLRLHQTSEGRQQTSWTSLFMEQFRAMSKCGRAIWAMFFFLFIFVTMAMLQSHRSFNWANAAVLVATFGQSFVMLLIVHRIYAKSYLSLDAITKFFAAGFLLAVPSAFVLEMIVVNTLIAVVLILFNVIYIMGMDSVVNFIFNHEIIFLVAFQLFNAFIVAALTEESCKYFVFRMVEHPDLSFLSPTRGSMPITDRKEGMLADVTNRQKAAAITIAMLSVALGLACAENFLYVFYLGGRDGGKASDELMTLVFRSIFPVHAMCAAMQSVIVVKKYIELDPSRDPTNVQLHAERVKIGVGATILPAVILHGSFDAVLMVVTLFLSNSETSGEEDDAVNQSKQSSTADEILNIVAWVFVITITIAGAVWYFSQKAQQRVRLQKLDDEVAYSSNQEGNRNAPILSMYREALAIA